MVAKINIGSSLYGALAYNQEKVDEGLGKVLGSRLVFEPVDGAFSVSECMNDFMRFVPAHFRTEKPVFHVSINPHPDDRLSDDQLADIGHEYMQRLGYGNQPYLIFKHEDIGREHIHIVSLRVDSNGKKLTITANISEVSGLRNSWNANTTFIRRKDKSIPSNGN